MSHALGRRLLATAALAPILAAAGACGGSSEGDKDKDAGTEASAATASCTGKLLPAKPSAALPSGFPTPSGAVFYQLAKVGKTEVHFGYVKGDNVVTTRDAIKAQLTQAGFTINGTDQEPDVEAELDADSSAHGGTLQVIHLCNGYLRLRFSLDH
jgi:hypothetical protein